MPNQTINKTIQATAESGLSSADIWVLTLTVIPALLYGYMVWRISRKDKNKFSRSEKGT